jgi:hypothetical protein
MSQSSNSTISGNSASGEAGEIANYKRHHAVRLRHRGQLRIEGKAGRQNCLRRTCGGFYWVDVA